MNTKHLDDLSIRIIRTIGDELATPNMNAEEFETAINSLMAVMVTLIAAAQLNGVNGTEIMTDITEKMRKGLSLFIANQGSARAYLETAKKGRN